MRGTTRWLIAASAGALSLVLGCTAGEGELVVDGSLDPASELAAAVEATLSGTGRFEVVERIEVLADAGDLDGDWSLPELIRTTGEFAGGDVRGVVDIEGPNFPRSEFLRVDGRTFVAADVEELGADWVDDDTKAELRRLVDGRRWIEQGAGSPDGRAWPTAGAASLVPVDLSGLGDVASLLGTAERVVDVGTEQIDGVEHRRVAGVLPDPATPWSDDVNPFGEAERVREILDAAAGYIRRELTAWISPEGLLRRVELSSVDETPERYRGCFLLGGSISGTATADFLELGADVAIELPDPSDVVDESDVESILTRSMPVEPFEELAGEAVLDDPDLLEDDRELVAQTVRDGASLIGLDPAAVAGMTMEELVEAAARIWDAAEVLPRTTTSMGELNRIEMLGLVRMGMEWLEIDPATADSMSDEQLGAAIDGYLGTGRVGAGAGEELGLRGDGDLFESCPG